MSDHASNDIPALDEDFVAAPASAVHTVEIDGEAVLLDETRERLHLLNASATLVWQCFDGQATLGEIVSDLSDVLDEPREQVLVDTIAVTQRLVGEGLVAPPARSRTST